MEIHNDENNIENNNLNANAANGHNENHSGADTAVDGTNIQQNICQTENVVTENSANNKSIEANETTLANGLIQREQNEIQKESTVAVVVTSESDELQSVAKNQTEPVSNENECDDRNLIINAIDRQNESRFESTTGVADGTNGQQVISQDQIAITEGSGNKKSTTASEATFGNCSIQRESTVAVASGSGGQQSNSKNKNDVTECVSNNGSLMTGSIAAVDKPNVQPIIPRYGNGNKKVCMIYSNNNIRNE